MEISSENYKETLRQLKKQFLASRFLRWWVGELVSMLPVQLRSAGLQGEHFTFAQHDASNVMLSRFENGTLHEVGSVGLQTLDADGQRQAIATELVKAPIGQREVALALTTDCVLRKTLTLPMATEENLQQVLQFQMEQYTPFPAAQVYFGYCVTDRDFVNGQLSVDFAATPRHAVDAELKMFAEWGVPVRAVVAKDMLTQGNFVNLLPTVSVKTPSILMRGVNRWLVIGVGLLALGAVLMPLVIKRVAVVQLLPWVEKGRKAAETVDALRRELEAKVSEHNYLLEKKQALPPVVMALEELARVLPDDTWVQQLDIKGKELQIQGETASSVRLIGLFEQSAIFRDASFRSPLTKGQTTGSERYQLALQMRPLVAQQPAGTASAPLMPQQAASSPVTRVVPAGTASVLLAPPHVAAPPVVVSNAAPPKASDRKPVALTAEKKP